VYSFCNRLFSLVGLLSGSKSPPLLQSVVTGDITVSDKAGIGDVVYTFVALVHTSEERESLRLALKAKLFCTMYSDASYES